MVSIAFLADFFSILHTTHSHLEQILIQRSAYATYPAPAMGVMVATASAFLMVAGAAGYSLCPDGSAGLTQALYEAGDSSKYANVTCIPLNAFRRTSNSKVELFGRLLPELTTIEQGAFDSFKGTLILSGSFPLLSNIGIEAFCSAGNTESVIELVDGLPSLTSIGANAFRSFNGRLTVSGNFSQLSNIGGYAFHDHSNTKSKIELLGNLMPSLTTIGENAFYTFGGTLIFGGSGGGNFPQLSSIGQEAFQEAGNSNSRIELGDGLPKLVVINESTFKLFGGTLTFSGSFPLLISVGEYSFNAAGNDKSKVDLVGEQVPQLATIAPFAFWSFSGTLAVTGSFPGLNSIGKLAFTGAGTSSYANVAIACSSEDGLQISESAFVGYEGTHDASREQCSCSNEDCSYDDDDVGSCVSDSAAYINNCCHGTCANNGYNGCWSCPTLQSQDSSNYGGKHCFLSRACRHDVDYIDDDFLIDDDDVLAYLSGDWTCDGDVWVCDDDDASKCLKRNSLCAALHGASPALCWDADTRNFNCVDYQLHGYTCVGYFCAAIDPTGDPDICAILRPAGWQVNSTTGKCFATTASLEEDITTTSPNAVTDYEGGEGKEEGIHRLLCPDGSTVLTQALYEAGDPSLYANVTCIPRGVFWQSTSNSKVELFGRLLPELTTIAWDAFGFFKGTLILSGSFPLLSNIGIEAFCSAGNTESVIELVDGLPSLTSIGANAFRSFNGRLTVSGNFSQLSNIGGYAFHDHSNTKSKIELLGNLMPSLTTIGENAFYTFGGTLIFGGSGGGNFPQLSSIGQEAFQEAGNSNSRIELGDGLPKLVVINESTFKLFGGTLTFSGSFPLLISVGEYSFNAAGNDKSKVDLVGEQVPQLATIAPFAFWSFSGTLAVTGSFPGLNSIGKLAFTGAGTSSYANVAIACSSEDGLQISESAFVGYEGTHDASREQCSCSNVDCYGYDGYDGHDGYDGYDGHDGHDGYEFDDDGSSATPSSDAIPLAAIASATAAGIVLGCLAILAAVAVLFWRRRKGVQNCSCIRLRCCNQVDCLHNCDISLSCCNRTPSRLEAELCSATKERAQLTFLAKYSQRLFSTVQSAEEYAALVATLELPRVNIKMVRQLGAGNYGNVMLAKLRKSGGSGDGGGTSTVEVAVKSRLPEETDATVDEALLAEALVLHSLKHEHILEMIGICTTSMPFLVATERMANGDLKSYLRACRPSQPKPKASLTLYDVSLIAERIAQALAHLEKLSVIHRDVAARNVLVGTAPTEVKLGDLGAARSVFREAEREYTATSDHMPVRWMALESLRQASFTNKSDVWSFGVFCWEVTTHGKTPYGVFGGVKDISGHLVKGGRLEEAPFTPPGMFKQMLLCWSEDPKRRPRFADLVQALGAIRGAVAVGPEATMVLDSNGEVVQRSGSGLAGENGGTVDATEIMRAAVSNTNATEHVRLVLNPTFGVNIGNQPAVAPDGYVQDNFEQGSNSVEQSHSSTAPSGQPAVAPDGYVQDNFEQGSNSVEQSHNSTAPSGQPAVAPDGYVQDNFEQGSNSVEQSHNSTAPSGQPAVAPDGYAQEFEPPALSAWPPPRFALNDIDLSSIDNAIAAEVVSASAGTIVEGVGGDETRL